MVAPEFHHHFIQLALAEHLPVLGGRDHLCCNIIDVVRKAGIQLRCGLRGQREQALDGGFQVAIVDTCVIQLLLEVGIDAHALYRAERVAVHAEAGALECGVFCGSLWDDGGASGAGPSSLLLQAGSVDASAV